MKKFLLAGLLSCSVFGFSQSPQFLNLVKDNGGVNLYTPYSICKLANGNNVVGVEITAGMVVLNEGGFVAFNNSGNVAWHKTYTDYKPTHVIENGANMYGILSNTHSGGAVAKINPNNGTILWAKTIDNSNALFTGAPGMLNIFKESSTINTAFYSRRDNNGTNYVMMVKVDASGNSTFSKRLDSIYPVSVIKVSSDYLLLGKKTWQSSDSLYYLLRLDASMNTVWSKQITFPNYNMQLGGLSYQKNNIYVGGSDYTYGSSNPTGDAVLLKFDGSGNLGWSRSYFTNTPFMYNMSAAQVVYKANRLFVLGYAQDSAYAYFNSFTTLDTNGVAIKNRVMRYNTGSYYNDFAINSDTSLYTVGNIDANPGFNYDMYESQFDLSSDLGVCVADSINVQDSIFTPQISVCPVFTPVNETTTLTSQAILSVTEVPLVQGIRTHIDSIIPTTPGCANPCSGEELVYYSGLDQNPMITWSANAMGQTGSYITGLCTGTYTAILTDMFGCTDTANAILGYTPPPTPDICMVTVDSMSTHNIVYWDKTNFIGTGIDSFRIYREDVTNIYTYIGAVPFDSLSEYHDYAANPNVTTKRYKMSVVDTCGIESALSPYHNTIYITYSGGGQYNWNPQYTIENSPNPVTQYLLMRDDNSTGTWAQIASTAGTQFLINDPAFASYPNGSWRVETSWSISCTPTRGAINTSRSNIKVNSVGVKAATASAAFSIYPNPANNQVTVEIASFSEGNTFVELVDVLGQTLLSQAVSKNRVSLDVSRFAEGVYFIRLVNGTTSLSKKIIIE
jgi:hypothetical protein